MWPFTIKSLDAHVIVAFRECAGGSPSKSASNYLKFGRHFMRHLMYMSSLIVGGRNVVRADRTDLMLPYLFHSCHSVHNRWHCLNRALCANCSKTDTGLANVKKKTLGTNRRKGNSGNSTHLMYLFTNICNSS